MARLGSRQLAGYYPAPKHLLPSFASVLRWPDGPRDHMTLLDPCAGDGEAIATLRELWTPTARSDARFLRKAWAPQVSACELEADRAASLKERLEHFRDQAFEGDAFRLSPVSEDASRAAVLYLNPPYDHDPDYGRLEHRFLVRFSGFLHPGCGVLMLLVPGHALDLSADHLARHFTDLRAWRLPEEDFARFGQVLLIGRRVAKPLPGAEVGAGRIEAWARAPEKLPELAELAVSADSVPDPLELEAHPKPRYELRLELKPLDVARAAAAFRPWQGQLEASARELVGARYEVATPPKPAHIALTLSSGMMNGHELGPNDPDRHPPLLVKGLCERERVPVEEKTNSKGEVTGVVEVERPKLRLTTLRLDTFELEELEAGTEPTGEEEISEWNAADLIEHYRGGFTDLLARQFPALHDPKEPSHQLQLPELARAPYRVQAHAIRASLKLLSLGRNPLLSAEVGTGKTTMALSIAAALSAEHHAATTRGLASRGFAGPLPRVEKTLVLCPPHLLGTWAEEARAVVPEWRVQEVRSPSDLGKEADLYLLSRETAKLGHAWRGVGERCPRCGVRLETSARRQASRRLRCTNEPRRPADEPARLAEELAALTLPAAPGEALVRSLVAAPALEAHYPEDREPGPVNAPALESLLDRLTEHLASVAQTADGSVCETAAALSSAVEILARALGLTGEMAQRLTRHGTPPAPNGVWWKELVCRLDGYREKRDADPTADELPGAELVAALERLHEAGTWVEGPVCDEPLFAALPRPRRVPLAEVIRDRYRREFDLLVIDEVHEYANDSSAQSKAAQRLMNLPGVPTLALTGSLMAGYASSLFTLMWALSPLFREEFGRGERSQFCERYGYQRTLRIGEPEESEARRRGTHTDREVKRRKLGEAPGVMPSFILKHLLPTAVMVHKAELDRELPPMTEEPAVLEVASEETSEEPEEAPEETPSEDQATDAGEDFDRALLGEYRRLEGKLLERITSDRFDPERSGRLLGALLELPSYLDRATSDLPPFELRYPESVGGDLVARGRQFPAAWQTPKERWLLESLRRSLDAGERVLVYLRHTGSGELPGRLLRLIRREVTEKAAWLDAGKVSTSRRQGWIDEHVLDAGVQILLVNPNAVRTGLNNLIAFSTAAWYQLDWSAQTYRQANGRLHRIGQTRPVTILTPYYAGTAQEAQFHLVARKVTASLQVDGLDLKGALEAAGASEDDQAAAATAMSLGQAVYRALTGRGRSQLGRRSRGRKLPSPAGKSTSRKGKSGGFNGAETGATATGQLSLL